MSQVIQTNGDYKIKTPKTSDVYVSTRNVLIDGNLTVTGTSATVDVVDMRIEDNIIRLNRGETGNGVTKVWAGVEIDRGFSAPGSANPLPAFLFNETDHAWEIVDQFGLLKTFNSSTLKVKTIATDSGTDGGDLTLIGTGTGVVKVTGASNYYASVTNKDHIPNKQYVDLAITTRPPNNRIQRGDTYVIVQDTSGGATARAILGIASISINQTGLNYRSGDIITLSGGSARVSAKITVGTVNGSGSISTFTNPTPGEYISLPISNNNVATTTNSLTGSGATFDVTWEVVAVEILTPGNDYSTATVAFSNGYQSGTSTVTASDISSKRFTAGSTTGANIGSPVTFSGTVFGGIVAGKTYYIASLPVGGTQFTISESPTGSPAFTPTATTTGSMTVTITSTATATVTVDNGTGSATYSQVTGVNILLRGSYLSVPTVTFSAGSNPSLTESLARVYVDGIQTATFYNNRTEIGGLEINNNTISNNTTNSNIVLNTNGTATVEVTRAIQLDKTFGAIPYVAGSTLVYSDPVETVGSAAPTTGGTGIYYNNYRQTISWQKWVTNNPVSSLNSSNLSLYPVKNELISKQRALAMSMIF
jgi:hypothetical protein